MNDELTDDEPYVPFENDQVDLRRQHFAQVNASLALEGMVVDATDLAVQEAVATGSLSSDDAVNYYLKRAVEAKK